MIAVNGITDESFNLWKHHPVSLLYRRYLTDYRDALIKTHLDEWHSGKIDQMRDLEIRGRVAVLSDMIDLTFSAIENFYPEQEGSNGSEAN